MHRKSRQAGDELFDVLGRRWALRLLWEIDDAGLTYRELASRVPDMSTSVLTQRLRELRSAGLIDHAQGYRLTATGHELQTQLGALREWAERVGFASADLVFIALVFRRVRCLGL
jgi:DNA-binding HxlR family transcriptional regulator